MAKEPINSEVVIVGGGMVGMAMALSLSQKQIANVLIESHETDCDTNEQFDDRTLVINPASKLFWKKLGLWSDIEPYATCIDTVHVSNQGKFGVVQFDKDELGVTQLGHVIAARKLAQILIEAVQRNNQIEYLQPAKLSHFEQFDDHVSLAVEQNKKHIQVQAQLMIGADGVQSSIRKKLKLDTMVKSYQRKAIICNVTTDQKHHHRAYERLTQEGPMALLPFTNESGQSRFGFVWSMNEKQAAKMIQADEADFMGMAQERFGYRAGIFQTVGRRSQYPLFQIKVPVQHAHRVVLMGNAAHAVSPVSAQGLNLAVRGVDRLSKVLKASQLKNLDIGAFDVLQAYQKTSAADQDRTLNYTDDLMTWFKIDEPIVNTIRSMGLVAINANKFLKKSLYETAGGLR